MQTNRRPRVKVIGNTRKFWVKFASFYIGNKTPPQLTTKFTGFPLSGNCSGKWKINRNIPPWYKPWRMNRTPSQSETIYAICKRFYSLFLTERILFTRNNVQSRQWGSNQMIAKISNHRFGISKCAFTIQQWSHVLEWFRGVKAKSVLRHQRHPADRQLLQTPLFRRRLSNASRLRGSWKNARNLVVRGETTKFEQKSS